MSENKNTTTGVSGTTLLQIAFIVLKLCKVINWSWWWVMAPTWISISLIILLLAISGIMLWRKKVQTKKRLAVWMNEYAWKKLTKKEKSKWQQRVEEMQRSQINKQQ